MNYSYPAVILLLALLMRCGTVSEQSSSQVILSTADSIAAADLAEEMRWKNSEAVVSSYIPLDSIASYGVRLRPLGISYEQAKALLLLRKDSLKRQYEAGKITLDTVREAFTEELLNTIIPYWYGTAWSFDGHTSIPKKGSIACGYFVSTTLKDVGLNLNRYRLAQLRPIDAACSLLFLRLPDTTYRQSEGPRPFASLKEGIYFIGLSTSHVGFLLQKKNTLFLIHANYSGNDGVVPEFAEYSMAFSVTTEFFIAPITHSDSLMKCWLYDVPIQTKTPTDW